MLDRIVERIQLIDYNVRNNDYYDVESLKEKFVISAGKLNRRNSFE